MLVITMVNDVASYLRSDANLVLSVCVRVS